MGSAATLTTLASSIMSTTEHARFLISAFALHIPTLLVCIVACILTATKWKQAPDAAMWASFGFGLAILLCVTTPVGHWLIQRWILEGVNSASRVWAFTVFGFFNAVLHAVVYIFLLVAVYANRPRS